MRLLLFLATIMPATTHAHYHMLLPDRHSVKTDDKVAVTYQFGHPFEHELFDTEKPASAIAFDPDGKSTDLLPAMEKVAVPGREGKKVAAYRFTFQPARRGDHTLFVESPPIWMEDEKQYVRDVCRVTIHVETQNGWDRTPVDLKLFTVIPYTRPYGLRAGTVFQAGARQIGAGLVSYLPAELERYNATPPKELPPDEHITFSFKTDPAGVATCILPEPGWWAITVTRRPGQFEKPMTKERDGKQYPVIDRATIWVPVDDKVPLKPVE